MKPGQFVILLTIGVACVCLSLVSIVFAQHNRKLQAEVQAQQLAINKGALSQQIGANLLRETGVAAQHDEKLRQLLADNGYKLSTQPSPSPTP
jgi:Na+-translocating ferredoxin:NAD+ oxidoreductase RnfG subunit